MTSTTSPIISTPYTPYAEAVATFIESFSLWDLDKLSSYISDNAERIVLLASSGRPPTKGKEELQKAMKNAQENMFDLIKVGPLQFAVVRSPEAEASQFELLEYIEALGKAVLHVSLNSPPEDLTRQGTLLLS